MIKKSKPPQHIQSIEELEELLEKIHEDNAWALEGNKLQPHKAITDAFFQYLSIICYSNKKPAIAMNVNQTTYVFAFNHSQGAAQFAGLQADILLRAKNAFSDLYSRALQDITLEVLPDKTIEQPFYFCRGKAIIETNNQPSRYKVYDFRQVADKPIEFELLSDRSISSLELALDLYTSPEILETRAIVRVNGDYPLQETILPIFLEKYKKGIDEQNK